MPRPIIIPTNFVKLIILEVFKEIRPFFILSVVAFNLNPSFAYAGWQDILETPFDIAKNFDQAQQWAGKKVPAAGEGINDINDIPEKSDRPPSVKSQSEFDISIDVGRLDGDTTYEIGNIPINEDPWGRNPYFPISRLEFPLNVTMASLDFGYSTERWSLSAGLKKNINKDAGEMKDSDWGVPFWDDTGPEGPGWYVWVDSNDNYLLDIYSNSQTDLDALEMDINLRYQIFKNSFNSKFGDKSEHSEWISLIGLGYIRSDFSFESRLIRQWSPSGLDGYDFTGNGEVGLTYDVTYSIPYVELVVMEVKNNATVEISIGYSPLVKAKDKDVHLLRTPGPIYADGDCDGDAFLFSLKGYYNFINHWFLSFQYDYKTIKTSGTQANYINAGSLNGIAWNAENWVTDEEITSQQNYFALSVGYKF